MTIHIDHLRLRLPPGYETRADDIVRRVANSVASLTPGTDAPGHVARLHVPTIAVEADTPDTLLADRVALAIAATLEGSKR